MTRLMKIAFFSDCYLDLSGGIVSIINTEKSELERDGHTVYVFSSAYPHSRDEKAELAEKHIYIVPSFKFLGRGIVPIARRPKTIIRWLKKNFPELKDFDCFYVHYEASCSIAGLKLAKEYKIPAIQMMHGREDVGLVNNIPFGLRTATATLLNFIHSIAIPHKIKVRRDDYLATSIARAKMWTLIVNHANYADFVITPSAHFLKKIQHYGVTVPAVSSHPGIKREYLKEPPRLKKVDPGETIRLIWHSRLQGEKRILPFLEALSMVKGKYHLSVYGEGFELTKAKKYAIIRGLNVTFYGQTPFEELYRALKAAHLDILVSYNYDTFGMVLLEAATTATPAFVVDPDLTEILPKDSYILAQNPSSAGMARALDDLLKHPERISKMSAELLKNFKPNQTKKSTILKTAISKYRQ